MLRSRIPGTRHAVPPKAILEMFQHFQVLSGKRSFETVGEADEEFILIACWRASYDANHASRVHQRVVRSAHLDKCHDLRSGKNVIRLMRHWFDPNN